MNETAARSGPGSTASSLLRGLAAHDAAAWERFVRLYGPLIFSWCRRMGLKAEDAADRGQEVFLAVLRGFHRFSKEKAGSSFRGWLWRITRNRTIDWRRSRRDAPAGSLEADDLLRLAIAECESEDGSAERVALQDGAGLQARAIELVRSEFAESTWRAFWRTVVEEAEVRDVAAELGVSVNSVYLSRSRVLRRLRETLGEI